MGAYLSQPKTEKISTDEVNNYLTVGASSMQGWRNSQEDAHNAILNYDEGTSFFAVYDGHGGAEVAAYCADKLPNFLKNLDTYKNGDLEQALKEAFLGFDETLLETNVIEILKLLAGDSRGNEAEDSYDDDDEDLVGLHEESSLSLKEVLKRYGEQFGSKLVPIKNADENDADDDDSDIAEDRFSLSMPNLTRLREGPKPQSPCLRGRRAAAVIADAVNKAVLDPDAKPTGSSTSAAAAALSAADNDVGPSSSRASTATIHVDTDEDSTVSSTNTVANSATNNTNLHNNHTEAVTQANPTNIEAKEAEAASKRTEKNATAAVNGEADSSRIVKENEQNGSVTSSETAAAGNKTNIIAPSSSTATKIETAKADASVSSGSNEAAKKKQQQNGNIDSISASSSSGSTAASTSSNRIVTKHTSLLNDDDSTDDDADYDESAHNEENDDDEDDDEEDDDEEEDDDDEGNDEEEDNEIERDDAETIEANEQFCANMIEEPGKDSGCTAVVALLHGRDLYVANAGDSRCVVCRKGKAVEMSIDHKPEDAEETMRILKAGGRVSADGRVNGGLNLSRAIGDHAYKMALNFPAEEQMISALPDIKKLIISPEDEFLILACDGIWNYMSSDEVVEFVRKRINDNDTSQQLSKICEELFENCLAPNTMGDGTGCDNMTAVIVRFKPTLQELSTQINPEETEDILLEKSVGSGNVAQSSDVNTLKRIASSSLDEPNQQTKRLKTDSEEENSFSAASSIITSSTTSSQSSLNSQAAVAGNDTTASSSTSVSALISTSEESISANTSQASAIECDSGLPDSSEASASPA